MGEIQAFRQTSPSLERNGFLKLGCGSVLGHKAQDLIFWPPLHMKGKQATNSSLWRTCFGKCLASAVYLPLHPWLLPHIVNEWVMFLLVGKILLICS